MRLAALVAAVLSAAGCYQPSVEACRYLCNNQQCPNGLECNAQGMCAESATAMCQAMPDDGSIDAPPSGVNVRVLDRNGDPEPNTLVIFGDAQGQLVAEQMTNAQGLATAEMAPGGSATVVRNAFAGTPNATLFASTFLDLPADAQLTVQQEQMSPTRMVEVRWSQPLPPAPSQIIVGTSCLRLSTTFPTMAQLGVINLSTQCTTFDVILSPDNATDPTTPPQFATLAGQTTSPVTFPTGAWKAARPITTTYTRFPTNANSMSSNVSAWLTPGLSDAASVSSAPIDAAGTTNWSVPQNTGLTVQLTFTTPITGVSAFMGMNERFPATATTYGRSLDGVLLPWFGNAVTDNTARALGWQVVPLAGPTPATPDLLAVSLRYARGGQDFQWAIVGNPARAMVVSPDNRRFAFPDIPGDRLFEPRLGDSFSQDSVTMFDVEDAAIPGVRSIIFAQQEPFSVPELRHMTISYAN